MATPQPSLGPTVVMPTKNKASYESLRQIYNLPHHCPFKVEFESRDTFPSAHFKLRREVVDSSLTLDSTLNYCVKARHPSITFGRIHPKPRTVRLGVLREPLKCKLFVIDKGGALAVLLVNKRHIILKRN